MVVVYGSPYKLILESPFPNVTVFLELTLTLALYRIMLLADGNTHVVPAFFGDKTSLHLLWNRVWLASNNERPRGSMVELQSSKLKVAGSSPVEVIFAN